MYAAPPPQKSGGSWLLKGCLLVVVLGALGLGGIFFMAIQGTKPVVESADRFLGLLGQGKTHEAYESTSGAFRNTTSESDFEKVVKQLGLDQYTASSWNSRKFENNNGSVEGSVTIKNGGSVSLKINLVHEQGAWKVLNLDGKRSGATSGSGGSSTTPASTSTTSSGSSSASTPPTTPATTPTTPASTPGNDVKTPQETPTTSGGDSSGIPSQPDLEKMARQSLLDFDAAVKDKDFTAFHETLATPFKEQFSADALQTTFQKFIEKDITIEGVAKVSPTFSPEPALNPQGLLVLEGSYPTQPVQVLFRLKYLKEDGAWKLMGINVELK